MFILDGKPLSYDRAFSHEGVSYPANWLRLSTWEEKQRIGITEVPDPAQVAWDQRFYWGVDNPKDHTGLVELWISKVKETAGSLLTPTDWYVTRNAENGAVIPQDILDRRAEIRSFSNQKETAILSTSSTDELVAYVTSPAFGEWTAPVVSTDDQVIISDDDILGTDTVDVLPLSGGFTEPDSTDTISLE